MTRRTINRITALGILLALIAAFLFWLAHYELLNPNGGADMPSEATESPQSAVHAVYVLADPCGLTAVVCGEIRTITGYTSRPQETDSTPCIAADGSDICDRYARGENICASNAYPLGTRLIVEGVGECVVADRMAFRYRDRIDWYFGTNLNQARSFGVQRLEVREL